MAEVICEASVAVVRMSTPSVLELGPVPSGPQHANNIAVVSRPLRREAHGVLRQGAREHEEREWTVEDANSEMSSG